MGKNDSSGDEPRKQAFGAKVAGTPWHVVPSGTFHHIVGPAGEDIMEVAAETWDRERQLAELVCGMANTLPELVAAAAGVLEVTVGQGMGYTGPLDRLQKALEAARRAV